MSRGSDIIPLIGARPPDRLAEALDALDAPLGEADLAAIAAGIPSEAVAGTRYPQAQMEHLDSEAGPTGL